MGSFWNRFGIVLGLFWENVGTVWESLWDNFEINLGSVWDNFGTRFGHFYSEGEGVPPFHHSYRHKGGPYIQRRQKTKPEGPRATKKNSEGANSKSNSTTSNGTNPHTQQITAESCVRCSVEVPRATIHLACAD